MNPFLIYLIKSTISLTLLYFLFRITFRNRKSHLTNRILLVGIIFASTLIPMIPTTTSQQNPVTQKVEVIREYLMQTPAPAKTVKQSELTVTPQTQVSHTTFNLFGIIYISLILILILRLIISCIRVLRLINKAEKTNLNTFILAIIEESIQPFSFLKYIVLSRDDHHKNKEILIAHECAHISQGHAADLILIELFTMLHWFNPIAWMLKKDLKLTHEYLADQAVLDEGINMHKYQLLVLEKAVGEKRFALAANFHQTPIKDRIKMMNKTKEKHWHSLKVILYIPLFFLLLQAFAKPEVIEKVNNLTSTILQDGSSEQWMEQWMKQSMQVIKHPNYSMDIPYNSSGTIQSTPVNLGNETNSSENFTTEDKNIINVLQNSRGQLLIQDKLVETNNLKNTLKAHLLYEIKTNSKGTSAKKIESRQTVFLYQFDERCPKEEIEKTMRILGEVYLEVRQETSKELFNKSYFELIESNNTAINTLVPIQLFVAFPKIVGQTEFKINMSPDGTIRYNNQNFTINSFGSHLAKEISAEKARNNIEYIEGDVTVVIANDTEMKYVNEITQVLHKNNLNVKFHGV